MQYILRWCLDCLADQETDERGPCTYCHSERVMGPMTYNPGSVVFGGEEGNYTEYGTARPWQEQWYQVIVHFKELKALYQPGRSHRSDSVTKLAVEDFFDHCLRSREWVRDDALTTKRGKNKLENLFNNNESLDLGRDIANTAKHRGRNEEGDRNAVVRRVYHREDNSTSALIEWWMRGDEGNRHTQDALEIAEGCIEAWKDFLKRNNLRLWEVKTRSNNI